MPLCVVLPLSISTSVPNVDALASFLRTTVVCEFCPLISLYQPATSTLRYVPASSSVPFESVRLIVAVSAGFSYGMIVVSNVSLAVKPQLSVTVHTTVVTALIVDPLSFVVVPAATSTAAAAPNFTLHFAIVAPYCVVTFEELKLARICDLFWIYPVIPETWPVLYGAMLNALLVLGPACAAVKDTVTVFVTVPDS